MKLVEKEIQMYKTTTVVFVTLSPIEIIDIFISYYSCHRYLKITFILITTLKLCQLLEPPLKLVNKRVHLLLCHKFVDFFPPSILITLMIVFSL